MEQIIFTDVFPDGKIQPNASLKIKEAVKSFQGKRIYFKIGIARKIRSLNQNKYYFGCIIPIAQEAIKEQWGEIIDKQQAHSFLKIYCNAVDKITEESDGNIRIPKPTHDYTTVQFMEYIERCSQFLFANFNVTIPPPNSQADIIFNEVKSICKADKLKNIAGRFP